MGSVMPVSPRWAAHRLTHLVANSDLLSSRGWKVAVKAVIGPLGRDLHQTYFHYRFRRVFRQQFIQHCRVGIVPGGHKILIFFLAGFQRLDVFFCRHLHIHGSLQIL